jgi:hypothetical protein
MALLGVVANDAAAYVEGVNLLVGDGFGAGMTTGQIDVSVSICRSRPSGPVRQTAGTAVEAGTERL